MVIIGSLLKLSAKLNFQHAVEKSWYYLLHCLAQVSQLTKKEWFQSLGSEHFSLVCAAQSFTLFLFKLKPLLSSVVVKMLKFSFRSDL